MALELTSLKKAIASLDVTIQLTQDEGFLKLSTAMKNGIKSGVIQNFEFTYELCWKFMKRYLEYQLGSSYVDGISRIELFRLSAEHHLIEDVAIWKSYHEFRNLTVHTYDEETAEEIFHAATIFILDAKKFLVSLETRND